MANEEKEMKEEKVTKKKTQGRQKRKILRSISKSKEELIEAREKKRIVETVLLVLLAAIALVLLCNKTFFHSEYQNRSMYVELPMFTFYMKNKDNSVTLKTIRKSKYVQDYFDVYLSNLDYYECNGERIFYDKQHKTSIYSITVDRPFRFDPVKTITIKYSDKKLEDLCVGNSNIDPIVPDALVPEGY